jgi:hypothetical protein
MINLSSGIFQAVIKPSEPPTWSEANDLEQYTEVDKSSYMGFGDKLLRLAIVEPKDSDERFFVLSMHHSTYDAFALNMLFKELEAAYSQGFPTVSPPKMNQFIKYITESDKAVATDFWTSYLGDAVTRPLLAPRGECMVFDMSEKTMAMDIPKLHGTDCSLPKMIEVAGGLAIAHRLGCPDVIIYSDRSGRNLPVEGLQDLVGSTTLFLPVRIHLDPQQNIHDFLRDAQNFQKVMMPFEHLGWLELREMSHLKPILRNSVNMNIIPRVVSSLGELGEGLGLEFKSAYASCDDPFGMIVNLLDEKMEWEVGFDKRFIAEETVDSLLEDIRRVFLGIVDAHMQPDLTVGEVLESLRN